ncbi:MAG: 16S rRNA (adenine(1518)-N(6)/adenine(1519)-N(6))-dimethyltransferase RsmA [Acidimicrobiia bacterium]|nr:16S rRNA (adenine(1518)-N(6)/adenine(1519)-N(6))-dimethyltransferase RsmA [Acidimicrobiia bacterium]
MAEGALTRTQTVELLERHGLTLHKRYGQHFLVDPNIVRRIVRVLESPVGTPVLEVGAGIGTLTVALRDAGHPVVAYELDHRFEPALREVVGDRDRIELRFEDAAAREPDLRGTWAFTANLPYNVGTSILLDVIRNEAAVVEFVVMVQREVADRLVASPGSRTYGVPSVVSQLSCDVSIEFTVPPHVFLPPPNVGSAVLRLARHSPPSPLRNRAADLAAAAFGQRRKMLRSSLRSVLRDPESVLSAAGLNPSARAEELAPDAFMALATLAGVE